MARRSWVGFAGAFAVGVAVAGMSSSVIVGIINTMLIVGGIIGIVMGLELNSAVKTAPRLAKHKHTFGPWYDVNELNSDGSRGRVFEQVRRCTSPSCRYTDRREV